ncbi:MAG: SdiA-regulated domain-containing protein, partial [Ignavibacteriae bacterium]|nr:SdiA-regulated domain-containing protein [Ignavibacteriota bacterium]
MLVKILKISFLIWVALIAFVNCTDKSVAPTSIELTLFESIPIEIKEPSGLTFNNDKTKLWIVGDADPQIYLTDLRGNIEKKYFVSKQDLEGITSIGDSILAVVVEITREILFLNLKDNSESVYQTGFEGEVNNGLEGITYFPTEENLFIANEKNPKLIFKTNINAEILSYSSIDFTEDLAGLYFDQS